VVEVSGTPIILVAFIGGGVCLLGVIMQQTCLSGARRAHNMLKIALGVSGDVLLGEAITSTSDKNSNINDETAQGRHGGLESRKDLLPRPDIGGKIFGKGVDGELRGWDGALEGRVDVEGTVGIVGALEGVDLAVLEGLLSEGPTGQIL
jgi:hypothetical protein